MKLLLSKKFICGLALAALIVMIVAFVKIAHASTIHITADFYGSEPSTPSEIFPCKVEYLEDAVLAWNPRTSPPHFNAGTPRTHPATLMVDSKGVTKIKIKPLNQSADFIILSAVDIADREPDYQIIQVGQTSTIQRKDGGLFDREKLQISLELVGLTPDFEPLDPDFHFIQVWEASCHTS